MRIAATILVPITRQMTAPNGAKFGMLYDLGLVADNNSSASYVETSEVDTDVDGSLDWQEYITGTDPLVADGLEGVLNVVSNGVEVSTSPAVAERVYNVYSNTNLVEGAGFEKIGSYTNNIGETDGFLLDERDLNAAFYKAGVSLP